MRCIETLCDLPRATVLRCCVAIYHRGALRRQCYMSCSSLIRPRLCRSGSATRCALASDCARTTARGAGVQSCSRANSTHAHARAQVHAPACTGTDEAESQQRCTAPDRTRRAVRRIERGAPCATPNDALSTAVHQAGRQADRQTDRQADRQTDRQIDRQTDRQTTSYHMLHIYYFISKERI
jgi:hypothetical protein